MPIQTVGILLVTAGIWILYCGTLGIPVIDTFTAIIRNPEQARQIIADARSASAEKYKGLLSAASSAVSSYGGGNPFSKYSITSDWNTHLERGSEGGIDFAMPVGTPLLTPYGGTITNIPNNGTGGHTVIVTLDSGHKSVYYHVSKFMRQNGERVIPGTIVALSGGAKGAEGAGNSSGPHLHWHIVDPNGKRVNPLTFIGR